MAESHSNKTIRTRIAPSPTGEDIHIGNLYTALLNFAFAKKHGGKFLVRIEDTDRERLVEKSEEKILKTLKAYHLVYDEGPDQSGDYGPYRQSDRLKIYKKYALELVAMKKAYYCFCTKDRLDMIRKEQQEKGRIPKYDKFCLEHEKNSEERIARGESYVIRLNIPQNITIVFEDLIRGEIKFQSNDIDDQVLLKSDGFPTYHLAVVVDDYLMKITHVIRAEDWISSTPKHVLLYDAFGWEKPIFAHVPLLRNPDKSKLSKRKNPVWASWYLQQGFLPDAVLNFLALMGWSHPEEKEIFSLDEFIQLFDIKNVKPVGPVFDIKKLEWLNGIYIRNLSLEQFRQILFIFDPSLQNFVEEIAGAQVDLLLQIAKDRLRILSEFRELVTDPKTVRSLTSEEKEQAKNLSLFLENLTDVDWTNGEAFLSRLKEFREKENTSMKMIYFLLTKKEKGLPLLEQIQIFGKEKMIGNVKSFLQ